jgi:group I intron endonuclease
MNSIESDSEDIMKNIVMKLNKETSNDTLNPKSGIYKIVNKIDGKYYVGSSKSIKKRWIEHKRRLINNDHHNDHLQNTFNKHGFDKFDFMIIESVDIKNLKDIEQKYLDIAKTEQDKCYNLNFESTGGDLSEYSKIKISNALKGRRLSQQTRDKISNSKGGSVYPDDSTYYREYRRLNIDRIKSRDKEYRMRNRDKINEKKRLARKLKKVQTAVDNQTQI